MVQVVRVKVHVLVEVLHELGYLIVTVDFKINYYLWIVCERVIYFIRQRVFEENYNLDDWVANNKNLMAIVLAVIGCEEVIKEHLIFLVWRDLMQVGSKKVFYVRDFYDKIGKIRGIC